MLAGDILALDQAAFSAAFQKSASSSGFRRCGSPRRRAWHDVMGAAPLNDHGL